MGSITQKIFELLETSGNYEEGRTIGIFYKTGFCERCKQPRPCNCPKIGVNWFDAIDDRCKPSDDDKTVRGIIDAVGERKQKESLWNALNDIP